MQSNTPIRRKRKKNILQIILGNILNPKKNNSELNTETKPKQKGLFKKIVLILASLFLTGMLCFICLLLFLLADKPEVKINDFINQESSKIYDVNGQLVAELGSTIRNNITYSDLPNNLVDAFVAIEDSRFFEHNGFDLPRFTKATLSNILSRSFGQGGSTFTMQLIKNTYFTNDETNTIASRKGFSGIKRKVQEIFLAMEVESILSKQQIFELYLNLLNFGGSGNIRGVQKASQFYFGKDVKDISLTQAAMLAGVINAPNYYNPLNNLEAATNRRNTVLYQMMNHGYITKQEYEIAKQVKVEDELVTYVTRKTGDGTLKNQAYIDEVVNEVIQLTGNSPYASTMDIYTYLNQDLQQIYDDITDSKTSDYNLPDFTDEYQEMASIVVDNKTSGISAIMGGRNYSSGSQSLLNHATQQYNQPGSSIKPILDYALAFENLGWATSHVMVDKPIVYTGTDIVIQNNNRTYLGEVTIKEALGKSLNTPAIQALEQVIQEKGNQYCVDYLNAIGIKTDLSSFNIQYGIGGSTLSVSCKDMVGAMEMILNGGVYLQPHTIKSIEFRSGQESFNDSSYYKSKQVLTPASAYQTAELMNYNIFGEYGILKSLRSNYAVYGKTGTTNWGKEGQYYNIPNLAAKDGWVIAGTSNVSIVTWIGYDSYSKDRPSYLNNTSINRNLHCKVTKIVLDKSNELYGGTLPLQRPDDIVDITHIIATYPYVAPIEGMDEQYVTTGTIAKQYYNLVDSQEATIANISNDVSFTQNDNKLVFKWPQYPISTNPDDNNVDISLRNSNGEIIYEAYGRKLFDYSLLFGQIKYCVDVVKDSKVVNTFDSDSNQKEVDNPYNANDNLTLYYYYTSGSITSNKVSINAIIQDSNINLVYPSNNSTVQEITEWAKKYGISLEISENTSTCTPNTIKLLDANGNTITPGSSQTLKSSQLKDIKIKCEVCKTSTSQLNISAPSDSKLKKSSEYTFKSSSNVIWNVSSNVTIVNNSAQELVIRINDDANTADTITVTAQSNDENKTFTYTVDN